MEPGSKKLRGAGAFIGRMPPSDKAIAAVLALAFLVASFVELVVLSRSYMVEVPARGGTLVEGVVGAPRFANPLFALTDADRDLATLTYAGLMGEGPQGLRPVLAESYTVSSDGTVYTFTLRPNVKFTDGSPLTAGDVVFTIQKAQDAGLKSPQYANWANIRAEALDARTVRFTLPKAYAPFLEDTTIGILPEHIWNAVPDEQIPFDIHMEKPIGAGPFMVAGEGRDKSGAITSYKLVANPNYPLGRPYLDAIVFKYYGSVDELAGAYHSGAVKSAYGIPAQGAMTAPFSRVFGVFFNSANEKAFAQLSVRQALSTAINRNRIITDLGGYATPLMGPVPPGAGVTEPQVPAGDPTANARAVLTNAGWTYATTTGWTNKKLKLSIDPITLTTSNVPELKLVVGDIEQDWEALGVSTTLSLTDPNALTPSVIRPRSYAALYFGMVVGRDNDLYPFWSSTQTADPGLNIALYSDKTVDDLLAKDRTESDPAARASDLQKISDTIAAAYPAAFTYAPDFVYAVPSSLHGIVLPQITVPSDRFATVSSWYMNRSYVWPIFVPKSAQ